MITAFIRAVHDDHAEPAGRECSDRSGALLSLTGSWKYATGFSRESIRIYVHFRTLSRRCPHGGSAPQLIRSPCLVPTCRPCTCPLSPVPVVSDPFPVR